MRLEKRVQRVRVRLKAQPNQYEITIGAGALVQLGPEARQRLDQRARRILLISNPKVFKLYGERALESLRTSAFDVSVWLMPEGEHHKTLRTLERALKALSAAGLERGDALVALGGGVVGDLAGFAAAVYLRGIAFIQAPTTLLAQIDASVGGKTGVNTATGKNLVGAFHQPRAVLIDTETLGTLPFRELTAGWCEAIKQGAIGGRKLFNQTYKFLDQSQNSEHISSGPELAQLIAAQCAFKASIVAGDERESLTLDSNRSRRILNFGHTVAHALETLTRYRRFRHGEAVGYGMLVAGEISARLGWLAPLELELLRDAVRLAGPLPRAFDLDLDQLIAALAHDKKSVGGQLKWILLERLGHAVLVDDREIPRPTLRASLRAVLQTRTSQVVVKKG